MPENPWLTSTNIESEPAESATVPAEPASVPISGPDTPQAGNVPPQSGLPIRTVTTVARLWWVGVHGGAGESTLAKLFTGTREAGRAWPHSANPNMAAPRSVLVSRTHASGLLATQAAAADWASGHSGVDLVGLVLIADAPGRLPRPLKDLSKLISGGVPRVWHLPWIEAWRLGEPPSADTAPRVVQTMLTDIEQLITP